MQEIKVLTGDKEKLKGYQAEVDTLATKKKVRERDALVGEEARMDTCGVGQAGLHGALLSEAGARCSAGEGGLD